MLSPNTHAILRRISEAVPDPVAVLLAPDWRIVYANRSYRALAGAEGAGVIGRKVADTFPGVARCGALEMLAEARATGRTVSAKAVSAVLRPGAPAAWWDMDHHPLPDADGDLGAVLVILRNVTAEVVARREADAATAALRRRAEQMRLAIGAGRMFFWDFDVASGAVEWSEGLAEACGMEPGSFGGTIEAFRALVHPDDLPRVEAAIGRALAGEADYDIEFRMLRADGGERWVLSRATVERDGSGRSVRMVGIDLDLTERKRTEARLAANEARLRAAQQAAGFGTWEWDRDAGRQIWSPEQYALHGLAEGEGAPSLERWLELVHEDDRDLLFDAAKQAWDGAGQSYRALFRILRADDGAERWLAALGRVLQAEPDGTPSRMHGINFDVTRLVDELLEDRRRSKSLQNGEAFMRSVLDASTDCTKVVEPDGSLSFMNANGLCLMEIDDFAPLKGNEWAALWPEEGRARVRRAVAAALAGDADRFEAFCPTAKGTPRWWDVTVAPVRDAAGRVARIVASSRDITGLKQTQERLRRAVVARETLTREADHRIKNSLQMVAGLLRIQERRAADPATADALRKATGRVMAVAEAHRALYQSTDLRTVDLRQVLADMANHLGSLSPQVTVRCASGGAVPIDAERGIPLGLIASELLTNAVKHAYPAGEPGVVEAAVEDREGMIVLSVADEGRGTPPSPAAEPASSGLGSTLVRSMARQVGASVDVATGPGKGTRVTLTLPREPSAESAASSDR